MLLAPVRSMRLLGGTVDRRKDTNMAELHPELAKAKANTALQFLASFDNEDFGFLREDTPGPHDRRNLAMALDYIQELGAMVLNLADRVTPNAEVRDAAPLYGTASLSTDGLCNGGGNLPPPLEERK